ncbi:dihydrodipicolinate reductase C-terminal domain-containing protein [Mucisphaera sp.]|uniref:dihydrodipicolinate reductase C-terminal domain-containing protein n=1 Tax=Mucisphaera sp. TaxID=2913024 RepID=UPI003D13E496
MRSIHHLLLIGPGKTGRHVPSFVDPINLTTIDSTTTQTDALIAQADAAIIFLPPDAMYGYIDPLIHRRCPAVIGTTAVSWPHNLHDRLTAADTPWITASNFSIGMNLLYLLAAQLGHITRTQPEAFATATAAIHETHHIHKKDKPSGSALKLRDAFADPNLPVTSDREGDVAGQHRLTLDLPGEQLTLSHNVTDRSIFARGAVWAAQHLLPDTPPGLHRFEDLLTRQLTTPTTNA